MRKTIISLVLTAIIALEGCSAPTPPPSKVESQASGSQSVATPPVPAASLTPPTPTDATGWAKLISLDSTKKVVTITEDNDPNDLIGRPNGYISAAVIYDKGGKCTELSNSCGGTVEVWPSAADAQRRSAYIQGILRESPIFGTEYHTLNGAALLRIAGDLKPSVAKSYAAKFKG